MQISRLLQMIFTQYLIGLMIFSGIIISVVYPMLISEKKFPLEYKIGKYVGYFYIGFGCIIYFVAMLLG